MDGEKFYLATGDKSPFAYSTLPNKRRSDPYIEIEDLNWDLVCIIICYPMSFLL